MLAGFRGGRRCQGRLFLDPLLQRVNSAMLKNRTAQSSWTLPHSSACLGYRDQRACESWILTAELQRRIQAMEMRCCRKILRISYKDNVTNEEVRTKIQQAIGPDEDLMTIVKRRKLQWYGHVSRSSGLAKTISQGTVKGGRRQGRQRKRW